MIHAGNKEREGDAFFNVDMAGEYAFCFSNKMSTLTEKVVQFEIEIIGEKTSTGTGATTESPLDQSLSKIKTAVDKIHKMQNYFKTREAVSCSFPFIM